MGKAKKFGTFSGVFSPSILTILGVIMYLRFPAIIGQAGLINTIGIIVIAHIISVTTSLSVASLSTDKPVQNGGTYFMISRSLGLPIGGTLGLALFVGLSFSVSLYLIGFAESFLQYWGMDNNIQNIRLTGSIVLIVVTTVTFISTSLAIKSQYFIMVAIGLSLLSIFFGRHDFTPTEINFAPLASTAPFMILFGIFFPAVTGFEAGVSMSGDLKNPSKSLPLGAILAVGVGFIVYIGLAIFYAFTVDANALANDPQILFKISLVPALVIAGIWGATLSSALGSILGAPRILQAIAMDKIAPKFLAKGTGKTSEPRNALIIAFIIAEAGILIGELDVIARIVSMFFITTYAFLNLASAIESWSSSDFRPAFKIPRFVSILGAFSAFIVMILLDFLALAGATVVLGLLYFYLQRKELILESGDAWASFWTNMAKKSLLRLSIKKDNTRNWRPNIVLFSGGEKARPHLVDLGLELTGKLGALTDFNFVIGGNALNHWEDNYKVEKDKKLKYFQRKLSCNSIEEGIKTVTNVYGFSGFEPNTVLMGWSKQSQNREILSHLLNDLKTKNLNTIFLDYDKEKGFGKRENIDIWWDGKGRFLEFSLNILKFLQTSQEWRDSDVRLLIINSDSSLHDRIFRDTSALLSQKRIKADIKILSDDFGSRTKVDIIHSESTSADLLMLGMSYNESVLTHEYIELINKITLLPASVLLLCPSNEFEEINLVDKIKSPVKSIDKIAESIELPAFPAVENTLLRNRLEKHDYEFKLISESFLTNAFDSALGQLISILETIREVSLQNISTLKKEIVEHDKHEFYKTITRNHYLFLRKMTSVIEKQNSECFIEIENILNNSVNSLLTKLGNDVFESPESMLIPYRIEKKDKEKELKYFYRKNLNIYINKLVYNQLKSILEKLEVISLNQLIDIRNIILGINDYYEKLILTIKSDKPGDLTGFDFHVKKLDEIKLGLAILKLESRELLLKAFRTVLIKLANDTNTPENIKASVKNKKINEVPIIEHLKSFSEEWGKGIKLLNNTLFLDLTVLTQKDLTSNIVTAGNEKIIDELSTSILQPVNEIIEILGKLSVKQTLNVKLPAFEGKILLLKLVNESIQKVISNIEKMPMEIAVPELIYKDSEPIHLLDYNAKIVYPNKLASFYIDNLFREPLYRDIENLQKVVDSAIIEIKEACSLLLFQLNNSEKNNDSLDLDGKSDNGFYKKMLLQVESEKNKIEIAVNKIESNSSTYLHNSFSRLFYHALIDSDKGVKVERKETKIKRYQSGIVKQYSKLRASINNAIIYLINSSNTGVLLSKKYIEEQNISDLNNRQLLDFVEEITPIKKIYNSVPVFYRDLMSSDSIINDDFWVPKELEMKIIKNALNRHKNGLGGAIVIKGVHGAGKTTLSRHALSRLFKRNNTFWINAPVNGSTDIADLLKEFQKQIANFSDFNSIFNNLPYESALVINDLELWWERRPGGGEVILKLIELIKLYGNKVFFILNCNSHSFNVIKNLYPIEENALALVDCESFNSKELQQLILNRHKSSGINLTYQGKSEDSISQLKLSFLFNTYFYLSGGIPGVAINIWKSNIIKVEQEALTIQKPIKPKADNLCHIQREWLMVIALFIHHKQLNAIKLARITNYELNAAENLLSGLKNAGIIVSKNNDTFCLGRNIEPYLVNCCTTFGFI